MRKILLFVFVLTCTQISFAAFPPLSLPVAADSAATTSALPKDLNDLTKDQKRVLMEKFSKMSVDDYEKMTGKKMTGVQKLSFKLTQQRMKHQLKKKADGEGIFSNFNIGGFLLGFFLGLIGVLLAYIFSRDSDLRKWTWIGFGFYVIILIIILAASA